MERLKKFLHLYFIAIFVGHCWPYSISSLLPSFASLIVSFNK